MKIRLSSALLVSSFLTFSGFINAQSQSINSLFEQGNNAKIMEWIGSNYNRKVSVINERMYDFYQRRIPLTYMSCIPDSTAVLNYAIWSGNSAVYEDLLKQKKITSDVALLSEALNFAVGKKNLALVKRLEAMGAKFNAISPFYLKQNTLQIALSEQVDLELAEYVISKSDLAAFNHKSCLEKTALDYAAAYKDKSVLKHFIEKFSDKVFEVKETEEHPLELMLKRGNVNEARQLWAKMKEKEQFKILSMMHLLPRMRFHAVQSRNEACVRWVDSLFMITNSPGKDNVSIYLLENQPYDLTNFIDESLNITDNFLDLRTLQSDIKERSFLELLKAYQSMLGTFLNINPGIMPTFQGRSRLITYEDLTYVCGFFVNKYWLPLITKSLKPEQIEMLQEKQEIFYMFWDIQMPEAFKSNFIINFDDLVSYQGETLDRIQFLLSSLQVQQLAVREVTAFEFDYTQYFPYLNFIEIQWTNTEYTSYYLQSNLLNCTEIRFKGIKELQMPNLPKGAKLKKIYVPKNTKIVNLPKGFNVIYE